MEPVKLATCRIAPAAGQARAAAFAAGDAPSGVAWMKFGDELVYYEPRHWPQLTRIRQPGGRFAARAPRHAGPRAAARRGAEGRAVSARASRCPGPPRQGPLSAGRPRSRHSAEVEPQEGALLFGARPGRSTARAPRPQPRRVRNAQPRRGGRAAARASDPKVQALVDRLSRATFEADLTRLATLPTRLSTSSHYKPCDFAEQQLASLGYATSRQTITVNGKRSQNVLARRNGSGPASAAWCW